MTMLVSLAKDISLDTTELKEDVSKATRSIQEHPAFKNNNEQGSIIENLLYRFEYEGLFFWEVKQYDYTKG